MASDKQSRPKARTVRGFRDRAAGELAAERRMLDTIRATYESYGFDALETPFLEYTDALGSQRLQLHLGKCFVHRDGDVGQRIDERAVHVEEDGA